MSLPRRTFLRGAFKSTLTVGFLVAGARIGLSQIGGSTPAQIPLERSEIRFFFSLNQPSHLI